jgi:hypothetical protein
MLQQLCAVRREQARKARVAGRRLERIHTQLPKQAHTISDPVELASAAGAAATETVTSEPQRTQRPELTSFPAERYRALVAEDGKWTAWS